MFGFFIKKNFYDGWDNLFNLVVVNVVFLVSGFLFLGIAFCFASFPLVVIPLLFLLAALFGVFCLAYGETAFCIAGFRTPRIADFFKAIPRSIKDGALFGLLCSVIGTVSLLGIRFYLTQVQSVYGFLLAATLFWLDVIFILSLQWFVAIRSIMKNDFKKCLKKCFLIFFDNTGFSIEMAVHNLFLLCFSFVCMGFIPSFSGIVLAQVNALRLRLYKYDYLEAHPELSESKSRKSIPWEELIYEDRENLGPRTLKQLFFPWKN